MLKSVYLLESVTEVEDLMTSKGGHCELGELVVKKFRSYGVECQAKVHEQYLGLQMKESS